MFVLELIIGVLLVGGTGVGVGLGLRWLDNHRVKSNRIKAAEEIAKLEKHLTA